MLSLLLLLFFGLGQNSLLVFLSVVTLLIGSSLLWRPGEAPILLFMFCYQWLQASARIFHASFKGVDVEALSTVGGQVALASALSLVALLAIAAGLRLGAGGWRPSEGQSFRVMVLRYGIEKWARLYGVAWFTSNALLALAWVIPGLSQPMLAAASLKWAFFWMLAYASFARAQSNKLYLFIAFGLEFVMGIGGYFSDFKTVFFVLVLALAAAGRQVSWGRVLAAVGLGALLFLVGVIWTAVKNEYRSFVSGGAEVQVVVIDFWTRMGVLAEMVGGLDASTLIEAVDNALIRISYVDFFGVVLDYVPTFVPHEHGALWWDAISRPFMPRLFFPAKAVIDDSERTNLYTGLGVAGSDKGTSISIGYIGETYIDFGEFGMIAAIFLYGAFLGLCYRWFVRETSSSGLFGMALITSVLLGASLLESSITKVFGGIIVGLLVAWLLLRYGAPRFLPLPSLTEKG